MGRGGKRSGAGRPKGKMDTKSVRLTIPVADIAKQVDTEIRLQEINPNQVKDNQVKDQFYSRLKKQFPNLVLPFSSYEPGNPHREIRMYSSPVSAGIERTFLNDDGLEKVDLNEKLIKYPAKTFIIPVVGDSMIDVGIYEGDLLIVEEMDDPFRQPDQDDIIVAVVNDEVMVKRYREVNGKIFLVSENKNRNYKPLEIKQEMSFRVYGIVKKSIHSF